VSLPKSFWLIGLGHIGQAFLWSFGMLPFDDPASVEMVLQDVDELSTANLSTSVLTATTSTGKQKTREVAEWVEARGFRTHIVERYFADNFTIGDREPHLGICAVDNTHSRAVLEKVGFDEVIEAGLGSRGEEYLAFQIHRFPASRSADQTWAPQGGDKSDEIGQVLAAPAYQALARSGMNVCGLTTLAGKAVGASFVGVAVSVFILAELLRGLHDGPQFELIDGTFRSLGRLRSITSVSKQTIRRATTTARHR
jgi:hypothetical protein